jgi:hypothetical protein
MTSDHSPGQATAPVAGSAAGGDAPSLRASWARSAAFTYFVILAVAALAIGLGWPVVEWAFDARRLFR